MDGKAAFADVVRRLSRACAAKPDCNAAYPDVEQNLWAGMKERGALHKFRAGPQAPVVSAIPTLLRTGEFDAVTHRSFGSAAARTLRNSQVVETPGAGHGEGMADDCSRTMVRDFIANPLAKVDTGCLSTIPPLRFVTDVKAIAR